MQRAKKAKCKLAFSIGMTHDYQNDVRSFYKINTSHHAGVREVSVIRLF